jgi:hypothetical protein
MRTTIERAAVTDLARETALRILRADAGAPLPIPGALEVGVAPSAAKRTIAGDVHVSPAVATQPARDGLDDPERAAREIEGGGALGERRLDRHKTFIARLRSAFSRPPRSES